MPFLFLLLLLYDENYEYSLLNLQSNTELNSEYSTSSEASSQKVLLRSKNKVQDEKSGNLRP